MTHIERRRRSAKTTGRDVRDGERVDWSDRGIPGFIEVYKHPDGIIALWDGLRHVCAPEASFDEDGITAALRNMGHEKRRDGTWGGMKDYRPGWYP